MCFKDPFVQYSTVTTGYVSPYNTLSSYQYRMTQVFPLLSRRQSMLVNNNKLLLSIYKLVLSIMAIFADHHGCLIQLSCNSKTARRSKAESEFNNGLVITDRCISDGRLFEVHIDRKINLWSGSLAIGVVSNFSQEVILPSSAVGFSNDAWIYYEKSIFKNEIVCIDSYGIDLNSLNEGDSVGIRWIPTQHDDDNDDALHTSSHNNHLSSKANNSSCGDLHFYVNGVDQGIAASQVPANIYGVVDVYGRCAQVTIIDNASPKGTTLYRSMYSTIRQSGYIIDVNIHVPITSTMLLIDPTHTSIHTSMHTSNLNDFKVS